MSLAPDDIAAIAEAVAEKLKSSVRTEDSASALTASEVANRLGVSTGYVYRHQRELGAKRLGEGPKARLRFPAEAVEGYGESSIRIEETNRGSHSPRRRNPTRVSDSVPLLPVGRRAA